MRLLLLLALVGCSSPSNPMPDAPNAFGGSCAPGSDAPLSTCMATDGEVGWCVDRTCYRGCVNGKCQYGGTPTAVYNDCYCK